MAPLPADAVPVNTAGLYPAYVFSEPIKNREGKIIERRSVGYVFIPTFELEGHARPKNPKEAMAPRKPFDETGAVKDLAATPNKLPQYGQQTAC